MRILNPFTVRLCGNPDSGDDLDTRENLLIVFNFRKVIFLRHLLALALFCTGGWTAGLCSVFGLRRTLVSMQSKHQHQANGEHFTYIFVIIRTVILLIILELGALDFIVVVAFYLFLIVDLLRLLGLALLGLGRLCTIVTRSVRTIDVDNASLPGAASCSSSSSSASSPSSLSYSPSPSETYLRSQHVSDCRIEVHGLIVSD